MTRIHRTMTASPLDHVRRSLNEIEKSNLPGPIKSAARFVRRVGRSVMYRTRAAFNPVVIKRNIVYPVRNVVLRHKPLAVEVGGLSYVLAPEGTVPLEMWSGGRFEEHELEFILSVLEPGMTFVDVGANVGMFAILGAKKVKHGRVLAFEPTSWTYERLLKNVKLNGLENITTERAALGDRLGNTILHVNARGKDGLNSLGKPCHPDCEVVSKELVRMTTLDESLHERGIESVDVIKMDVEGAELLVFRGATRQLSMNPGPLVLFENTFLSRGLDYHPVEQLWFLQKYGYLLFTIDSDTGKVSPRRHGMAHNTNIIAVKPSHPAYGCIKERAR
jgi:FkbM family methyltransferase